MAREVVPRAKPSARPRLRYILFKLESPGLSRNDLINALRRAGGSGGLEVWLTRYDGEHGVLRTLRGQEDAGIRLLEEGLQQVGLKATCLSTSGTIAALERRYRGRVPRQRPR